MKWSCNQVHIFNFVIQRVHVIFQGGSIDLILKVPVTPSAKSNKFNKRINFLILGIPWQPMFRQPTIKEPSRWTPFMFNMFFCFCNIWHISFEHVICLLLFLLQDNQKTKEGFLTRISRHAQSLCNIGCTYQHCLCFFSCRTICSLWGNQTCFVVKPGLLSL